MRPAVRSTCVTYCATKGISRSRSPFTTMTLVSPVSKSPSTLPRDSPAVSTTSRPTRSTQYKLPSSASPSDSRGTATSHPRRRSAPSRSSQPASLATGPLEWTSKSSSAISRQPSLVRTSQCGKSPRLARSRVKGFILSQPCTPNGPTMRPITTRSASSFRDEELLGGGFLLAGDFALATLDQLLHGVRGLRAQADPVGDAIQSQAELGLGFGGFGVVEADALDEAAIARHARVGDDDVVEGAVLGSAARHTDDDHVGNFLPLRTGNDCRKAGDYIRRTRALEAEVAGLRDDGELDEGAAMAGLGTAIHHIAAAVVVQGD